MVSKTLTYSYKARDFNGSERVGRMSVESITELTKKLREQDLILIKYVKYKEKSAKSMIFGKIKNKELIPFTHHLRILYSSGIPLLSGLEDIQQEASPVLKKILENIMLSLKNGSSLSDAMGHHSKTFSDLYRGIVKVGEATGNLDIALDRLGNYLERREETKNRIFQALMYPFLLVLAIIGLIILLLTFVLPRIMALYQNSEAVLPVPTQLVLALSNFLINNALLLIIATFLGIIFFIMSRKMDVIRFYADRFIMKVPFFGTLIIKDSASAFANTMATLYQSGVNINESIDYSKDVLNNRYIQKRILQSKLQIEEGAKLPDAIKNADVFPPLVISMLKVGDETGKLDQTLDMVCKFYDTEIPRAIKRFMTVLEPTILVVAGGIVGFIILSILLPIYTLLNSLA